MTHAADARKFLYATHSGVLSTISARLKGYPFGSIAPFVLDHAGNPLILISTIAEHTKNIQADPRVSLIAFDPASPDMQAGARLTLVGDAAIAPKDDALRARYLRYLPQAASYFDMHDFQFYRIAVQQARYIGGFGKIHWIPGLELRPPANRLAQQEAAILDHMNADHAENLRAYCRHVHGKDTESAAMTGIDTDGFDVTADGRLLRFSFDTPVTDAQEARVALVALAQACRA
ncbi:MAG: HugZ family protein [Methylocystis sp.]|uniref:HugZ family pyridoxamine 5'-phosphate oxidase n=1 Tax=Methylocystis sp. TaxID=1911079 RepID=UPI003DA459D4